MKIFLFYHSLVSDWNHGNAHFLRGIASELLKRGHEVRVYEPRNGWSYRNWIKERGMEGVRDFKQIYPQLNTNFYSELTNFDEVLEDADLVVVHEWNDPDLVRRIGELKKKHRYTLLFHDTHHRSVTAPHEIAKYDLNAYDGVLAFGRVIRDLYVQNKWTKCAWTWHEAADTNVFYPKNETGEKEGDLVWIGNWGDDERTRELIEFLIKPVKKLGLKAKMYGVRYPDDALDLLYKAGIEYGGYLPSAKVPEVYSRYRCTVHVPRRAYAQSLPGIPTIRPFEALACGIPLISAPWKDSENLFNEDDFVMVQNGREMTQALRNILQNPEESRSMIQNGLETIHNNHTCAHRADQLLEIHSMISNDINDANIHSKVS